MSIALAPRRESSPPRVRLRPALHAAAFHNLLAELDPQLALRTPRDGAEIERRITLKTQPEEQGQFCCIWKIYECPVLRYVTHQAGWVFSLQRVNDRGPHIGKAPRRAALLDNLSFDLHGLNQLQSEAILTRTPKTIPIRFAKILWINEPAGRWPSREKLELRFLGNRTPASVLKPHTVLAIWQLPRE